MMKLPDTGAAYFLGIGGIGMSALARYFRSKGWHVSGYDKTPTLLTSQLEEEGILIHFEEDIHRIPVNPDLVIYTPAIPSDHKELQYFKQEGIRLWKRAEVLGAIADGYQTIAVAGTHGKTTTSTLCAHLLTTSAVGCQAFLGGISKNYDSNLLLSSSSPYFVAEADEFDRSFLQLHPAIAIITSIDADHLDIYGDHSQMLRSFGDFTGNIIEGGTLILKEGLDLSIKLADHCRLYKYSMEEAGDFHASLIRLVNGLYHFDFHYPGGVIKDMISGLPGLYNIENAVAALSAAWIAGASEDELRKGLATFQGVRRRFDIRYNDGSRVYIDDYAHHPAELKACISSARKMFSGRRITGIFQPHLFTRTRDFADEFARSLELLDEVILLPIYPAREAPIPGITSEMLLSKISIADKKIAEKSSIPGCLDLEKLDVLLTLGAGDIDTLVKPIESLLNTLKV